MDASWKRHCFSACAAGGSYGTALLFVPPKLIAHVCTGVRCSCRTASAASSTRPAPSSPLEIRAPIHGGHQSPWQEGEGVPPCSGEGCVSALSLELCPQPCITLVSPVPLPVWGCVTWSHHAAPRAASLAGDSSSLLAPRSCAEVTVSQ